MNAWNSWRRKKPHTSCCDETTPNSAGITVRRANVTDVCAISQVFGAAWAASLSMIPKMHTADEDRVFFANVVGEQEVYAAVAGRVPVGFIALTPGWVNHLYVHPDYHRRGIGSMLLTHAKALQSGLTLWTFQANAGARAFYERQGFRAVEFTDGSANEERTPDVRYLWTRTSNA